MKNKIIKEVKESVIALSLILVFCLVCKVLVDLPAVSPAKAEVKQTQSDDTALDVVNTYMFYYNTGMFN